MSAERKVRSVNSLLPYIDIADHGFDMEQIKQWREEEGKVGRPNSLEDFYAIHGLCFDCQAHGVQMVGWVEVSDADADVAASFGLDKLPLYEKCPTCNGTGRASRERWRGPLPLLTCRKDPKS